MSRPLPAEQHLSTRGSVQRYSHRRVAAHACGTLRRLEELSTAPKTWKCRLLSLHDLCAVERRTGVLGRGCCFLRSEGSQLPVCDTAPVFGGVVLPGVRGRRANFTSPSVVVSLSVPHRLRPCPQSQGCSARSLGGRESCLPQGNRFGKCSLLLSQVLTC